MRVVTTQLTLVMLLVHLGLGCCWHHTHSFASSCCHATAETDVAHRCDGHGHSQSHDWSREVPQSQEDIPHRQECDGETCSFIASGPSFEPIRASNHTVCFLDVVLSPRDADPIPWGLANGHEHLLGCQGLPVRAQLLFCVFLI